MKTISVKIEEAENFLQTCAFSNEKLNSIELLKKLKRKAIEIRKECGTK